MAKALSDLDTKQLCDRLDLFREHLAKIARSMAIRPITMRTLEGLQDDVEMIGSQMKPRNLGLETIDEQRARYAERPIETPPITDIARRLK
jgi:hypothetical protein